MTRLALERHQIWIYLAAILIGIGMGSRIPDRAETLGAWLWPALGLLLYSTFTQVPLNRLPEAFRDSRFISAALLGNFVAIPALAWVLAELTPGGAAVRLGVFLVLAVPCTDWFISFTHLGRGDTRMAIAITPVNLLAQIAAIPAYLWLFMGAGFGELFAAGRVTEAFLAIIVLPLAAAYATQRWASEKSGLISRLGRLPVPLLAVVVFLIASSHVGAVQASLPMLGGVLPVFLVYLIAAAALARVLSRAVGLRAPAGRTLAFSFGTRNSFVVLPIALALPPAWEPAAIVIVFQSLVELFGMAAYLRWVPRRLFPDNGVEFR